MFYNIFSKPIIRLSVVILVNENLIKVAPLSDKHINRRYYARWSTRKPLLVPDDTVPGKYSLKEDSEHDHPKTDKKQWLDREKIDNELVHKEEQFSSDQLNYKILEEDDSTFSKLMIQVGNRKMRRKHDIIMLEGKRLNMDAIQVGLMPTQIFFTQKSSLEELNLPPNSGVPLYRLPYRTMQLWSKLETPPGIVGFYKIPKKDDIVPKDTLPIKVLCDNVRDPGNLGSIIRVSAAVGCNRILLMKGCTDPWDSKVLRSASGGHFHIPISMDLSWNERGDLLQSSDHIFLADSQSDRSQRAPHPQLYHHVNFSECASVVVVVGGETEGLSEEALGLTTHHRASRLYIPLANSVESLNSGCALSVILFEIKRQFLVNGFVNNPEEEHLSGDLISAKHSN